MIVTCPECETGFQLDESRVPAKGIRVRCSRCKHAFHLAHPSASRSEAVDSIAAEAVAGGGTSTPSTTQDLTSTGAPAAQTNRETGDEINNEDDAEWEFNHDVPAADPTPPEPKTPPAAEPEFATPPPNDADSAAFESAPEGVESGLDLAGDAPPASGLDLDTGDDEGAGTASTHGSGGGAPSASDASSGGTDFGTVDDFSSLMEDDDPIGSSSPVDDQGVADELRESVKEARSVYSGASTADELGEPESWDFFDEETAPSSTPPPPPKAVLGRIALTSPGALDMGASTSPGDLFDESDMAEKGWLVTGLESAGRMLGWTVVLVGLALGLVNGLWTTAESFVAGQRVTALADSIEAADMRAQWVDTARSGRLLLVSGGLRNVSRSPARLPGPVEIVLLDRLGTPLDVEPTAVGVELAERQIRELPIEVLASMRARAAHQMSSSVIPAGGQLPFQAVIFDPPEAEGGMRFQVRLAAGGELSLPEADSRSRAGQGDDRPGAAEEAAPEEQIGAPADAGDPLVEPAAGETVETPTPAVDPAAPGYDNPYGEDSGLGLQDL